MLCSQNVDYQRSKERTYDYDRWGESARSIVRKNKIKSALNALLDLIDRPNENEA